MSAEEVAKAFVDHFYKAFDTNAGQLVSLFVRAVPSWKGFFSFVVCFACGMRVVWMFAMFYESIDECEF